MNDKVFLIIESADVHCLVEIPPMGLSGYRQHGGPFVGTSPFFTVFAKESVAPDLVAKIVASYAPSAA
ncbi:hypothetical protein N800_13480 [Lysobacter daejeonensis GH1-9]|uniref:Uncharacterized protein n=1 Tax=Lysobacter daejeonensis GH1-9 TaxID=1385517 RepID=A0A0A0EMU8_9GAMM|nr:hypothetical protein [Lysobacter daejeonensis]KGM51605.1 hypothetical protein N800_13480 [Lysobacter daejeonensis GH1-9]